MTCPVCGTAVVPGARFCFACGHALADSRPPEEETERRVVTVLFGDLSDFTSWAEDLDPERVGVVTDRVLASLATIVTEYGGHVDKLVGDGIMAVFGAPTAHEDDAERAVRAAARMQRVVRRLVAAESGGGRQLGLRVGLNTGTVVSGVQAQLAYTVIGDTVNTASRLADAAGVGSVVAGRSTAVATMPIAAWRALAPLRLKGKREAVDAFELTGLRPAGATRLGLGDEAPFVGRDAELGLLTGRFLEVMDARTPRSVLVSGEAGVGKTRLASELSRFVAEIPGTRVLWGRSAPYGEGRDLTAVAEMVRTVCGIEDTDDPATARDRIERTISRLEQSGPLLPQLRERLRLLLGLEETELTGPTGPRETATPGVPVGGDRVRQGVAALFNALAADGPLLLVLDDLHWATPTMVDGIRAVVRRVRGPVLFVGLGRLDMLDVRDRPDWWDVLPGLEQVHLDPLEESAIHRLLRSYLGTDSLDEATREALLDRAQGNPFYLAELLHLLVDRGVLARSGDDGAWVLHGHLPEELLPAGVQAVLAARIDGLDGAAKGVLRDASVVGLRPSLPMLEAVGRASGHGQPEVVRAAVDTLLDRRLLERSEPSGLRFGHTLVRDVAYAGLAKADRARRHAAMAVWAQQGMPRTAEADVVSAGQGERAVRLATEMGLPATDPAWQAREVAFGALSRLGQAALGRDDNVAAQQVLARAVDLSLEGPGTPLHSDAVVSTRLGLARALAATHRLEEAEAELAPALDGPDEVRAGALLVLGEVRRKRGDAPGALEAFVSALSAAGSAGADRLGGEALRQLGLLDYFGGRLQGAEERFEQARGLAHQVGDARGEGWALQHLAWSATTRGDYELADTTLERAAEVFAELEDSGGLAWVAGTEGFVRLLQGRYREAHDLATTLVPLGEATGERWGVAALLVIEAVATAELGDHEGASELATDARRRFTDVGDLWGRSLSLVAAGIACRVGGDPEGAVAVLEEAVRLAEQGRHPLNGSLALVVLGYSHLDRGDLDAAEGCVWRAGAALAGLDLRPTAALGARVLLAQVLRRRGQPLEALAELDAALAVQPVERALLFPRRQALAHRSGTLLELGRVGEALEAAAQALAEPDEDARSQVLALRAIGNARRAAGDEAGAVASLTEALEAARTRGPVSEVAATERLLASPA